MKDSEMLQHMIQLQESINTKVHPVWKAQMFSWYRAFISELFELHDKLAWKWWKAPGQDENLFQIKLELTDLWHFALSEAIQYEVTSDIIQWNFDNYAHYQKLYGDIDTVELVEACIKHSIDKGDTDGRFFELFRRYEITLPELYKMYCGKHALNMFRQNHGYNTGGYNKYWYSGKEDNAALEFVMKDLPLSPIYIDEIYKQLVTLHTSINTTA